MMENTIGVEVVISVGKKKITLTNEEMVELRDTLIKLTGFQTTKITYPMPDPLVPIPRSPLIGDFPPSHYDPIPTYTLGSNISH